MVQTRAHQSLDRACRNAEPWWSNTCSPLPRQGWQKRGALLVINNESWFPWGCICNKSFHLANTLTHHTTINIELIVSFISSRLVIFDYTYYCDSYVDHWLKRCSQLAYCLVSFTDWFFANMLYNILCWVLMKVLMMIPHFNVGKAMALLPQSH